MGQFITRRFCRPIPFFDHVQVVKYLLKRFLRVVSHLLSDRSHKPRKLLPRNRMFCLSALTLAFHRSMFSAPTPVGMYVECAVSSLCRRRCDRKSCKVPHKGRYVHARPLNHGRTALGRAEGSSLPASENIAHTTWPEGAASIAALPVPMCDERRSQYRQLAYPIVPLERATVVPAWHFRPGGDPPCVGFFVWRL